MATFRDSALSAAGSATAVNSVSSADQLSWQIGDVLECEVKGEGALPSSVSVDTGASTPTFSTANALQVYSNNDLWMGTFYWVATTAGPGNVRAVLGSSATRPYMELRVISKQPASGKTWQLGTGGAAPVNTSGNATVSPATAAMTVPGAGSMVAAIGLYGGRNISGNANFAAPVEYPSGSAGIVYRNVAGAETVTPTLTYNTPALEYILQAFYLQEVDPVAATDPAARSSIVNPFGPLQCGLRR